MIYLISKIEEEIIEIYTLLNIYSRKNIILFLTKQSNKIKFIYILVKLFL